MTDDREYPIYDGKDCIGLVDTYGQTVLWSSYNKDLNCELHVVANIKGELQLARTVQAIPVISRQKVVYILKTSRALDTFSLKGGGKMYRGYFTMALNYDHLGNLTFKKINHHQHMIRKESTSGLGSFILFNKLELYSINRKRAEVLKRWNDTKAKKYANKNAI